MTVRRILGSLLPLLAIPLLASGCAGEETCHMGDHVGGFEGDLYGTVHLQLSRVDADDLVAVTLEGDAPGLPLTGDLVALSAREGGCSDLSFGGDLVDADGVAVGTFEGALTTTTGEGTWALDSGERGTWALGAL